MQNPQNSGTLQWARGNCALQRSIAAYAHEKKLKCASKMWSTFWHLFCVCHSHLYMFTSNDGSKCTNLINERIFIVMSWEQHGLSAPDSELRMLYIFYDIIPNNDLIQRVELGLVLRRHIEKDELRVPREEPAQVCCHVEHDSRLCVRSLRPAYSRAIATIAVRREGRRKRKVGWIDGI